MSSSPRSTATSVRRSVIALSLLLLTPWLLGFFSRCHPTTTVVLVRHAEKLAGRDPHLKPEGHARAKALVDVVQGNVGAVYATETCRTVQTAEPLARELGLTVQVQDFDGGGVHLEHCDLDVDLEALPPTLDEAAELARRVLLQHAGETVVLVGHSNTVPDLVAAFGAEPLCPSYFPWIGDDCRIPDEGEASEYDNLFVITKRGLFGSPTLIRARYGD